jgi:hypothetical protein
VSAGRLRPRVSAALFAATVATILGAATSEPREPQRWALVVGVGEYAHFGDEIGGDLPGAANDARRVRDVLVARWGFPEENIRLLLDTEATRAAIQEGLSDWLPGVARPGDLVLFYFAGHGSQTWDLDGDEADGLDETIAPHDALPHSTENDIVDDELGAWLRAIPTRNIVAILDNCHAGTGTRSVPFARPRSLARNVQDIPRPEGLPPLPDLMRGLRSDTGILEDDWVVELAAARSDQVAVEVAWPLEDGDHSWGGAFTTVLVRHLWEVPEGTSYREVFRLTRDELKRQGFAQDPLLSARSDLARVAAFDLAAGDVVAAGAGRPAAAFIPILGGEGNGVRLGGGAAAGLTVGSLLEAGSALLRVRELAESGAVAEVVEGSLPPAGDQARLVAYRFPDRPLRVSIAGLAEELRAPLRTAVASNTRVALSTDADAPADLVLVHEDGSILVLGRDAAVRHALDGPEGSLGAVGSGSAGFAAALAAILAREADAQRLSAMENPANPFALEFGVEGIGARFALGEEVRFDLSAARDGYVTIVDLGTDGTITVLFPNEFDPDGAVRAGDRVTLPSPAMEEEGLVFEALEPAGLGLVRAFLTERPLELVPGEYGELSADDLLRALRAAAGSAPLAGSAAIPVGNWASASIVYEIHR